MKTAVMAMDELNISPTYLHMLILKARAVMVKEGLVTPEPGGNPIDDELPDTLQDQHEDESAPEDPEEIGLDAFFTDFVAPDRGTVQVLVAASSPEAKRAFDRVLSEIVSNRHGR
jgi:hypothetical protein